MILCCLVPRHHIKPHAGSVSTSLCSPGYTLHSVYSRNIIHSICLLLDLFLCDSAMTLLALTQLFCLLWLLWEETNTIFFFFLEIFYCTPTWADKNESDIRAQTIALFTWTYFLIFHQFHEICKFVVILTPSSGPVGESERDR